MLDLANAAAAPVFGSGGGVPDGIPEESIEARFCGLGLSTEGLAVGILFAEAVGPTTLAVESLQYTIKQQDT